MRSKLMNQYISLNVNTEYSMGYGICRIEDLVDKAVNTGMLCLAKTDYGKNGFYGVIDFYNQCKKARIKPIIGIKTTVIEFKEHEFILIVKNLNGYYKLCQMFNKQDIPSINDIFNNAKSFVVVLDTDKDLYKAKCFYSLLRFLREIFTYH